MDGYVDITSAGLKAVLGPGVFALLLLGRDVDTDNVGSSAQSALF